MFLHITFTRTVYICINISTNDQRDVFKEMSFMYTYISRVWLTFLRQLNILVLSASYLK